MFSNIRNTFVGFIAFRNILVDEYFRIDLQAVWKIVNRDLANLKNQVETILEKEQQN